MCSTHFHFYSVGPDGPRLLPGAGQGVSYGGAWVSSVAMIRLIDILTSIV